MPADLDYDFDRALDACRHDALDAWLQARPLPQAQLAAQAQAASPPEPYGRRVLHQSALGEVLLVCFREGEFCAPHGHGAARAFVCLLRGELTEERFGFDGSALTLLSTSALQAPSQVRVPSHTIHRMQGRQAALALHFYVPAIRNMQVYDVPTRRTLVVRDSCGAWIPDDASLVMSSTAWT